MANELDGIALGAIALGGAFIWSGIKGKSILQVVQNTVQGKSSASSPTANAIGVPASNTGGSSGTATGTGSVSGAATPSGSGQTALKNAAKIYGWDTGSEWQALNNIELHEAGYSSTVANKSSGALGIAQALGHGTGSTAGTLGNEYGGYGLTDAQARAANSGDAGAQSLWMVNYIKSRYGDPSAAWAQYVHADGTSWY